MSIYKGNNLIASSGLNIDLTPDTVPTEGSLRHVMSGGVYTALLTKEDAANKTTVVDASSTDDQYPSAKAVYNALGTLDPVDIEYARELYAPNWSQAVAISRDALLSGYTAPKRGIFVGSALPKDYPGKVRITLNGTTIAYCTISTEGTFTAYVSMPAAAGDVIRSSDRVLSDSNYMIYFVPYKRQ